MTNTPQEPLWRVMNLAWGSLQYGTHERNAAEIRAVADWLLPKEQDEPMGKRQQERQALRQRLLAEADRAERGE